MASDASALVLGEIRSSSRLGELLHAEIGIEEEAADRFDVSCVKLYRPTQASNDLPWITEARLSFRRENGKGKLYISSDYPLREPVVQIGVQSSCTGGRVWREYAVLASPAGAGNELSRAPILPLSRPVTPPSRLAKKIVVSSDGGITEQKTGINQPSLRLSAWDAADSARQPRSSPSGSIVIESGLPLHVSFEMRAVDPSTEPARDVLRLEYRLLTALLEQADAQLALANTLPLAPEVAASLLAGEKMEPAATTTAVLDPVVLRVIPKVGPEAPAGKTADGSSEGGVYSGIGAVLFLVLLIVIRRRRGKEIDESLSPMHAPTILAEHPLFVQSPAQAFVVKVVDNEAANTPSPRQLPSFPEIPPPPEDLGLTPVMELAEIMMSFGRVDGAAQTLQDFIEANPKAALQPWMRLLEIYRESGMRADFDALATNLNQNFNIEVVHWDDVAPGERVEMSLEILPHIRDQIDALWGKPECFEYLQQLLRDNRDGQRAGFTLSVVKEILLLIDLMVAEKAAAK